MNSMPNSDGKAPVIPVLTGPTGAGKTALAFQLMDRFKQLEMISADSRQIYKGLSIGTDKPLPEDLARYPTHLVDCVEPGERFTAFDFVARANEIIADIFKRGRKPLICGGTGLYIKSLVEGIVEIPDGDFHYRDDLEALAAREGPEALHAKLKNVDPIEAVKVHPNNVKKIIRALEIYYLTGRTKTEILTMGSYKKIYDFVVVCFMPSRTELYERINSRVDRMLEAGLLDEVDTLIKSGFKDRVARINVIGYNELLDYRDGRLTYEEAVNLIKQNSRRFAKRQITWFNGMSEIQIFNKPDGVLDCLINILGQKTCYC
jgi:tRNA dimethylallyltransferase